MGLIGALSTSLSGLHDVNQSLGVVSQNIANIGTPNYAAERATQSSDSAGGFGLGVRSGLATRMTDPQLQSNLLSQNSTLSELTTRQQALQRVDVVQGQPGGGTDLASLVGKLADAFSSLQTDTSNQAAQSQTVSAAQALAQQINSLGSSYIAGRQDAQDSIVSGVGSLNVSLATLGKQSDQIIAMKAAGVSTADLENQRDQTISAISQVIDIKTLAQPSGDLLVITPSGLNIPIHAKTAVLSTSSASIGTGASYPSGGIAGIMMGGSDVTAQLKGGQLGGLITLRDTTLPTYQGELDEFSNTLANRFDAQGLTLFTDPGGSLPVATGTPVAQSGYIGFSSTIGVNPAVAANPALLRDGTHAVAGSPTGASAFTPNPSGGPASFSTMVGRILSFAIGTQAQSGVAQTPPTLSGLGPSGTLSAPIAAPLDLASFASDLVGTQSSTSADVTSQVGTAQSLQSTLKSKLGTETGVNLDTEMSTMVQLQNAYAANARIVSVIQSMFTQTLQMVP